MVRDREEISTCLCFIRQTVEATHLILERLIFPLSGSSLDNFKKKILMNFQKETPSNLLKHAAKTRTENTKAHE